MTIWAVYDDSGIWGAGDTPKQALDEAAGYMRDRHKGDDYVRAMAGCRQAMITPELLARVIEQGPGFRGFRLAGETLVAADTREAAHARG